MSEKYFVASNSSEGFCSYYDNAFDINKFKRIYAIKGGSGTGKAFFMRTVAQRAEDKGYTVRYIYCSSDAASLDAIIIDELKIAVLDGTAPHTYEPKLIGAVDSIVDLGAFLNNEMLSKSRKQIDAIVNEKKQCFERAYRYLNSYHLLSKNIEDLVLPCIKFEKIKKYANNFLKELTEEDGKIENRLVRSIGMRGLSSFDSYYENSKIYYEINDYYDTAHIFVSAIYKALDKKRVDVFVSNNPIIKERLDAIRLQNGRIGFEITNDNHGDARKINMKRFVDVNDLGKIREQYRAIARLRDGVLDLALLEFENIKKHHFVLEDIYGLAMDFEAKEKFTEEFCNKIL